MNRWYARDLFIVGKNTLILNAGIVKGKVQSHFKGNTNFPDMDCFVV